MSPTEETALHGSVHSDNSTEEVGIVDGQMGAEIRIQLEAGKEGSGQV